MCKMGVTKEYLDAQPREQVLTWLMYLDAEREAENLNREKTQREMEARMNGGN